MIPKVTYLIGAGASDNKHPLANKDFKSRQYAETLYSFLHDNKELFYNYIDKNKYSDSLYNKYLDIAAGCLNFGTPDTYAKWLYENGFNIEYNHLKRLISTYFSHNDYDPLKTQIEAFKTEHRILPFLTSVMENGTLPSNVKIISWNYDSQFEIAASNSKINYSSEKFNSKSYLKGFTAWPNIVNSFDSSYMRNNDLPFLIHLNGIAGFKYSQAVLAEESITPFLEMTVTDHEPLLSFSWEKEGDGYLESFIKHRINIARDIVRGTDILVIIGYSFPFLIE